MTDSVDEFVALLRKAPGVGATVDRAKDPRGESFIDITGPGLETQVSYRPSFGFGFFTSGDTFGQRPNVVVSDPATAARQVLEGLALRSSKSQAGHDRDPKRAKAR